MLITKEFKFDAAHRLTKYHGACERMHGHTYKLQVTVAGDMQEDGMVLDFVILKKIVTERVLSKVDHHNLNDLFENPTSEVVIKWIWEQLVDLPELLRVEAENLNVPVVVSALLEEPHVARKKLNVQVELYELKLWETSTSFVTYRGKA